MRPRLVSTHRLHYAQLLQIVTDRCIWLSVRTQSVCACLQCNDRFVYCCERIPRERNIRGSMANTGGPAQPSTLSPLVCDSSSANHTNRLQLGICRPCHSATCLQHLPEIWQHCRCEDFSRHNCRDAWWIGAKQLRAHPAGSLVPGYPARCTKASDQSLGSTYGLCPSCVLSLQQHAYKHTCLSVAANWTSRGNMAMTGRVLNACTAASVVGSVSAGCTALPNCWHRPFRAVISLYASCMVLPVPNAASTRRDVASSVAMPCSASQSAAW